MALVQRSPVRFVVFLVVLAALISYVVMKWEAFQEQALEGDTSGWETLPVVMPDQGEGVDPGEQAAAGDERDAGLERETASPSAGTGSAVGEIRAISDQTFFAVSRLERERARSQRIELLQQLIDNPNTDADTRRQAEQELVELSRKIAQEAEIESLIQARGFENVLVYLYDDASVVIIQTEELTDAQAAQAADAVAKVAGVPFPSISVMARAN